MDLCNKIAFLRKHCGFSQADLARKTGMSPRTIQNCEFKGYKPKNDSLIKIAKALNVDINVLLDDETFDEFVKNIPDSKNIEQVKHIVKKNKKTSDIDQMSATKVAKMLSPILGVHSIEMAFAVPIGTLTVELLLKKINEKRDWKEIERLLRAEVAFCDDLLMRYDDNIDELDELIIKLESSFFNSKEKLPEIELSLKLSNACQKRSLIKKLSRIVKNKKYLCDLVCKRREFDDLLSKYVYEIARCEKAQDKITNEIKELEKAEKGGDNQSIISNK